MSLRTTTTIIIGIIAILSAACESNVEATGAFWKLSVPANTAIDKSGNAEIGVWTFARGSNSAFTLTEGVDRGQPADATAKMRLVDGVEVYEWQLTDAGKRTLVA